MKFENDLLVEGVEKFRTRDEALAFIRGARLGHVLGGPEVPISVPDEPSFECDSVGKWTYNVNIDHPQDVKNWMSR